MKQLKVRLRIPSHRRRRRSGRRRRGGGGCRGGLFGVFGLLAGLIRLLPRAEVFLPDQLHFNAAGYKLLVERVRPYLPAKE